MHQNHQSFEGALKHDGALPIASPMRIGFVGPGGSDASDNAERNRLIEAGCLEIVCHAETSRLGREWHKPLVEAILPRTMLIVTSLDRFGLSATKLTPFLLALIDRGAHLKCLDADIDTSVPDTMGFGTVLRLLAEVDLTLARSRAAHARGVAQADRKLGGRKPMLTHAQVQAAQALIAKGVSRRDVAAQVGVSIATVYKYLPAQSLA